MPRSLALALVLLASAPAARADDAITPEVVRAVKSASVYVRVEGDGWGGSGSGFVVAADGGTVLVVTNHHVAVRIPAGVRPKPPAVSVILDSGARAEREYPAEVVAADADRDLAVLRLTKVKDAPKPVAYADPPVPVETMTVYSFGFPLGQGLATGKGFPAVTVGRASVSSLRADADGELAHIQIDGNLNPGNSGGPVVDGKGRLVGVAVARARDGQGIGFIIPAAEVVKTMAGRVGKVRVATRRAADGKATARVEADLIDPAGLVRGATAYYVVVPPKGKKPAAAALDKHPDAKKLALAVEKGVGAAEFAVDKAEGEVVVQVVGGRAAGQAAISSRTEAFPLAPGPRPEDLAGPPPDGWKEYAARGAFAVWLPEKPARQRDEARNLVLDGLTTRTTAVAGATAGGLTYRAEAFVVPPAAFRFAPHRLHPVLRGIHTGDTGGRITDAKEVAVGDFEGAEFRIESRSEVSRARVYVHFPRAYLVRVTGTKDQVAGAEAETILGSFHRVGFAAARKPEARPAEPPAPGGGDLQPPKPVYRGKHPAILGSIPDRKFKVVGPEGAVLVGLEAKFVKFGTHDIVRAVRPLYRVGGKEVPGGLTGADLDGAVTLRAKDGYAVGAISGKAEAWCHGFSLTFMRVKPDGSLDPKDSYDSDWAGWNGTMQVTKLTGDGTPAVGLVGKVAGRDTTALGLLFKGQEGYDPAAPAEPEPPRADPQPPRADLQPPPKALPRGKEPVILGSIRDPQFKTVGPAGAILIGLEARFEKFGAHDIVRAVRPIYRAGGKEEFGKQFGTDLTGAVTLKAKDGYAVGGITGKANLWCHGFRLTFMKVKADGTLDPKDAYDSDWAGWDGTMALTQVVGDGAPVVGIVGKIVGPKTTAVGLLFKGQEEFDPAAPARPGPPPRAVPRGKDPTIFGGAFDPPFKDAAPAGGLLVGFEVGLGKFFNRDMTRSVRPIYRAGGTESFGAQYGTDLTRVTTFKAKPGYAAGAMTCRHGLGFDGLSLTYMKVKPDGTLDPKDRYESDWIGTDETKRATVVGGDGTPVVGVVGKTNAKDMSGLGLLFKGQEDFVPAAGRR